MQCPDELKRLYHEGRVLPFVGAGASMSVTWEHNSEPQKGPSWKEMVSEAIKLLDFEHPELLRSRGTDLQILEYFKAKFGNMQRLINWLHSNMLPPDEAIQNSQIHSALAQLDKCNTIYTTNYDNFIERAFTLHGIPNEPIASEIDLGRAFGKSQIVKFHGDFNNPDHMVFSESDYEKRIRLEDAMDLKLRSDILGKAVIFIGYSFRDWNVSYIFRLLNDKFGGLPGTAHGKRAYIIAPTPSDFERRLFEERQIEVIPVGAHDLTANTARILNDLRV